MCEELYLKKKENSTSTFSSRIISRWLQEGPTYIIWREFINLHHSATTDVFGQAAMGEAF